MTPERRQIGEIVDLVVRTPDWEWGAEKGRVVTPVVYLAKAGLQRIGFHWVVGPCDWEAGRVVLYSERDWGVQGGFRTIEMALADLCNGRVKLTEEGIEGEWVVSYSGMSNEDVGSLRWPLVIARATGEIPFDLVPQLEECRSFLEDDRHGLEGKDLHVPVVREADSSQPWGVGFGFFRQGRLEKERWGVLLQRSSRASMGEPREVRLTRGAMKNYRFAGMSDEEPFAEMFWVVPTVSEMTR